MGTFPLFPCKDIVYTLDRKFTFLYIHLIHLVFLIHTPNLALMPYKRGLWSFSFPIHLVPWEASSSSPCWPHTSAILTSFVTTMDCKERTYPLRDESPFHLSFQNFTLPLLPILNEVLLSFILHIQRNKNGEGLEKNLWSLNLFCIFFHFLLSFTFYLCTYPSHFQWFK